MSSHPPLPREQLIGWIAKQLTLGIRTNSSDNLIVPDLNSVSDQLGELYTKKKTIVDLSRSVSNRVHASIAEAWRSIELRYQLAVKTGEGIADLKAELPVLWKRLYDMYTEDLAARAEEDTLRADERAYPSADFGEKKKVAMDMYLHERYLYKTQIDDRSGVEKILRERVASLSADLHALKDFNRVKQSVVDHEKSARTEKIEMKNREREYELMEEEIRLISLIEDTREKSQLRSAKLRNAISKLNQTYLAEKEFLQAHHSAIAQFKTDISYIRADVKAVEAAVSKFRSYLRHEDKAKREEQSVRE
jgi:hypothetical protein